MERILQHGGIDVTPNGQFDEHLLFRLQILSEQEGKNAELARKALVTRMCRLGFVRVAVEVATFNDVLQALKDRWNRIQRQRLHNMGK